MIVRYFIQDPLWDASSNDDYLLVFQIPEKSRNERAFVHLLQQAGLEYIREECPRKKPVTIKAETVEQYVDDLSRHIPVATFLSPTKTD